MRWNHSEGDDSVVEISRDAFGSCWTLEDDSRFWRRLGGGSGLLRLWQDAKEVRLACRRLGEHPSDRTFLMYRLHLMRVCVFLSFVEGVPRIVYKELPHFFARFAAQVFCEMLSRAELVAEEDPEFFRDHEWAQIHCYTYRSAAGTAAR